MPNCYLLRCFKVDKDQMAHIIAQALQKKSDPNSVGLPAAALGSSRPVSISGTGGFTLVLGAFYMEGGDIRLFITLVHKVL